MPNDSLLVAVCGSCSGHGAKKFIGVIQPWLQVYGFPYPGCCSATTLPQFSEQFSEEGKSLGKKSCGPRLTPGLNGRQMSHRLSPAPRNLQGNWAVPGLNIALLIIAIVHHRGSAIIQFVVCPSALPAQSEWHSGAAF